MTKLIRWGMCGAGRVAHDFTKVMHILSKDHSQVVAVAARDLARAQQFASEYNIARAYGSYEELANDTDIDIVYVNTITSTHYQLCKLMLEAGKAVLCEKPMSLNLKQAEEIIQLAKKKDVFFMEGYWSRCFPIMNKLRQELDAGSIGEVNQIVINFGQDLTNVPRLRDREMGGGVLLDLGCYPLQFVRSIFKDDPIKVTSTGCLFSSGVDVCENITLVYKDNRIAFLNVSGMSVMDQTAYVCGTEGVIKIPYFWCANELITPSKTHVVDLPEFEGKLNFVRSEGFMYEQECIRDCLRKGAKECSKVPHADSLAVMAFMDEARRQLGVVYDVDK